MSHTIKNLKRGALVVIDGELRTLLGKPQKAIDGTYRVSYQCVLTYKSGACYLNADQLLEIAEGAR